MDHVRQQWTQWLENIPLEQKTVLADLLHPNPQTNGHSKTPLSTATTEVKVTRTQTQDLYIKTPPPYLDIFNLHAIYGHLAFNSPLLLKGPKGDGKSLSVISWGAANNIPIVIQECSEDTKKYDLQGSQSLIGDETIYVLGCIPTAIDVANEVGHCILLFEELNALTPQVQKQLNAVTDFRKESSLPAIGRTYRLKEGARIWVVGTMNPSTYAGSYDLNEDLKSRFEEIEVTYPAQEPEKKVIKAVCGNTVQDAQIDLLIRFAKETRQQATGYALSTRDLVRLVNMVGLLGLDTALQMVLCKFEGEDRDTVMKRMVSVFGPRNLRKYWGA